MGNFNEDKYYSLTNAAINSPNNDVAEAMKVAVDSIYKEAVRRTSIPVQMKTIIIDLEEIRLKSPSAYDTARLLLCMYPTSYGDVAKARGVSKPAVYNQFKRIAKNYPWAEQIFQLMKENS